MDLIKIALLLKKKFLEFYDVKVYRKHSSEQLIVKKYSINNQKIIIDESSNE